MPYWLLADAVVALHFAFILFALLGGSLIVRFPRVLWLHVPTLTWGSWIAASGNICPLTPLENNFRDLAGQGTYGGGFIDRYITPIIYPEGLTRGTQAAYGAILIGVNLVFYWRWWRERRRVRSPA